MKSIFLTIAVCFISATIIAQTDSTKTSQSDTIRIGGMVIIKKDSPDKKHSQTTVSMGNNRRTKHSNISTTQFIIDFGFANWNDKTNYQSATSQGYLIDKPGTISPLGDNDFKLRAGKSSNVNIWVFMQRLNLIKHFVNLKYGIGVELNNYRFTSNISFKEGGSNPYAVQNINHPFVFRDSITFSKNKLSADYITVPFMLNFITNPNNSGKGLSFSAGVSMGYLYNSRNKQISGERGKLKNHGDYGLKKWKFSYIGELGLGGIRLYGSYVPTSIFEKGFDIMPYTVGIRLSNW